MGQVEVEQALASAGFARFLIFERQQRRVANQQSGVGDGQHGFEIGRMGDEQSRDFPEPFKQDARISKGSAGRGVGGDRSHGVDSRGADHQEDGTNTIE